MNDQLYRQQIIDHYKNPRNIGKVLDATHSHKLVNRSCGDEVEVFLKINDKKIVEFKYEIRGCAISVASASLLSEEIQNMSVEEFIKLDNTFIEELIGTKLTSSRIKCAMLAFDSIKKAISK